MRRILSYLGSKQFGILIARLGMIEALALAGTIFAYFLLLTVFELRDTSRDGGWLLKIIAGGAATMAWIFKRRAERWATENPPPGNDPTVSHDLQVCQRGSKLLARLMSGKVRESVYEPAIDSLLLDLADLKQTNAAHRKFKLKLQTFWIAITCVRYTFQDAILESLPKRIRDAVKVWWMWLGR